MIKGVKIKKLRVIPDERGRLMEIFRREDEFFAKFGQVYLTTAYPGVVKAWHFHKKQDDNITAVKGMARVALYDGRKKSSTYKELNEFFVGEHNPLLIHIPKGVYHGFKCISEEEVLIINIPTESYNGKKPDEFRLPAHTKKIPYNWEREDK